MDPMGRRGHLGCGTVPTSLKMAWHFKPAWRCHRPSALYYRLWTLRPCCRWRPPASCPSPRSSSRSWRRSPRAPWSSMSSTSRACREGIVVRLLLLEMVCCSVWFCMDSDIACNENVVQNEKLFLNFKRYFRWSTPLRLKFSSKYVVPKSWVLVCKLWKGELQS